ncbi:MAG: inositol monophosphatase [Lentisphaerae bacterium]|nr:inositol monophosphatase [Lentisphaerota bacterium]
MTTPVTTADLLSCALDAATAASAHAAGNPARRKKTIRVADHDVKLELDVECQRIAEKLILGRFPDHGFLGEEDTGGRRETPEGAFEWIVDPIDGTVNFTHGFPFWCCSVAVRSGGRAVAGVLSAPETGEIYTATFDGPALLNGKPLQVSSTDRLAAAIVMTGSDRDAVPGIPPYAFFQALASRSRKVRLMGCAALDLCRVARGHADAYFEAGIFTWDIAAAELIVRRAGGCCETIREFPGHRIAFLGSNGRIHGELLEVVNEPFRPAGSHA